MDCPLLFIILFLLFIILFLLFLMLPLDPHLYFILFLPDFMFPIICSPGRLAILLEARELRFVDFLLFLGFGGGGDDIGLF